MAKAIENTALLSLADLKKRAGEAGKAICNGHVSFADFLRDIAMSGHQLSADDAREVRAAFNKGLNPALVEVETINTYMQRLDVTSVLNFT